MAFSLIDFIVILQVTESDAVDVIETVLKDARTSLTTQAYALTALLKLSSRFPTISQYVIDADLHFHTFDYLRFTYRI